jgi:endonuclease-8
VPPRRAGLSMPEGDTIWRTARTLRAALAGRSVTAFESSWPEVAARGQALRLVGRTVEAVEPRGKHLLLHFSGGATLHTHLRMTGSWHVYRPESRWRAPAHLARAVVRTEAYVAVCFAAPVVELLTAGELRAHVPLQSLGPDLLAPDFDPALARERLRARNDIEVGDALLDQTALAGIGNVYKSEVLFLCGVNPFRKVAHLPDEVLDRIVATAGVQMKRNLGAGIRRTTSGLLAQALWVYEQGGKPCRRCGTAITRRLQGAAARSTYWCPGCQPKP